MSNNKLSFSISSKPSSRPTKQLPINNDESQKQQVFVTEFDPSKILPQKQSDHVIPALENQWKPQNKMRNLDIALRLSSDDPNLRFELEAPTIMADADPAGSYGLILRSKEEKEKKPSSDNVSVQRFKEDMVNLPDDRGADEFVGVPVEGYGAAVLSAYGWSEGMGVGRRETKDVPIVQYVRKNFDREGLGFIPETNKEDPTKKKSRYSGPQMVAPKGPDGRNRHVVGIDEKLVPRELKGIHAGKTVRVIEGRHEGLKGNVLEKFESKSSSKVVLKLSRSGEKVTVRIDEVAEVGSVDEENWSRKATKTRKRDREEGEKRVKEEKAPPSWLTSRIRVRVISKDFKRGKLYLKKGEVVDVIGPRVCDISMDETNELVQGIDQDILETALPRCGGPVLVLFGKHKGVFGNLVEKDNEKETGVVRDADSHELLNVRLEQVAEYIGDPSDIGY
ncbi:hypothetical protein GIB67_006172 [Kingdonia uniflora]|uniref:G-patch domain-containing protein n=1 Tax=Kingdonia uniflora TaxID=39325 RepID=A0A7J7LQ57_9MAGN|nr:hypothetical protein GIB67_006172 [Kingdonia uniflora]